MVGLNLKFIRKPLYGQLLIGIVLIFVTISMVFMWVTWMERFSGNANFFYF